MTSSNNKNNIIIVSDNSNTLEVLVSKILLLRKNDCVIPLTYNEVLSKIETDKPICILLHECKKREVTIQTIKQIKELNPEICVILLYEQNDADFILNAFDCGADDFCDVASENYELVIRIIKALKASSIKKINSRNEDLMAKNVIIDELTGFYNYKFANDLYENQLLKSVGQNGIFAVISPAEESKKNFSIEKLADAVKKSVRYEDIVSLGKGAKIYIMFPKSEISGVEQVIKNIKSNYGLNFNLKAGLFEYYDEDFKQIEKNALNALSEAIFSDKDISVLENKTETLDDWLSEEAETPKNFKLFKQTFNKKLEKVIAPVFYRLQKIYEEKLFDTKINQYVNEEECVFHLKNENQDSRLKIVYPGFSKIIIYIIHEGFDSPENSEISLPLSKITQSELIKMIENFIKEFRITSA